MPFLNVIGIINTLTAKIVGASVSYELGPVHYRLLLNDIARLK